MSEQINQAKVQLEKLKEAEEKAIQAIQQNIDESAKEMAAQHAEHQKQKQEFDEKYANFAKEMASLKEELKDKIDWNQVDRVMGFFNSNSIRTEEPSANDNVSTHNLGKKKFVSPIANAQGNSWNLAVAKKGMFITADGLYATKNIKRWQTISAEKGFIRSMDFSGPVLHYFEVAIMASQSYKQRIFIGFSGGNIPEGSFVGFLPDSYAIRDGDDHCLLSGNSQKLEWPNGAIKPTWKGQGDILGCGLLLNAANKMSIFFTGNGILMGKQMPINPTATTLYPTVSLCSSLCVKTNFGDDSARQFKYDIGNCPGLVLE